uniref:Uncharacterized protein n=1 Tax=Anguilla anguilla TaxID=7936 RepID=A0A0E9V3X1_ANGAN
MNHNYEFKEVGEGRRFMLAGLSLSSHTTESSGGPGACSAALAGRTRFRGKYNAYLSSAKSNKLLCGTETDLQTHTDMPTIERKGHF